MNRLYTPGQLARWEAARLKREALVKPAPISASLPGTIQPLSPCCAEHQFMVRYLDLVS
jgi:hypothetical protein